MSEKKIELKIRVSEGALSWAVWHINEFIADQPVNTEHDAHEFVSALTNPVEEVEVAFQDGEYRPTGSGEKRLKPPPVLPPQS